MSSTLSTGAQSVSTSATKIGAAQTIRKGLLLQNLGAADVYIGGSGVTTATGIKLVSGDSVPLGDFAGDLYGITGSGTADVRWLGES